MVIINNFKKCFRNKVILAKPVLLVYKDCQALKVVVVRLETREMLDLWEPLDVPENKAQLY